MTEPSNDPFGFMRAQVPREPEGKYQTVAVLWRVAGWVALVGSGLSVLFYAWTVTIFGTFADPGWQSLEGLFLFLGVIQMAFTVLAGGLAMILAGRALEDWSAPTAGLLDRMRARSIWLLVWGAGAWILGGSMLTGLTLIGLAIALLIITPDDAIWTGLGELPADESE